MTPVLLQRELDDLVLRLKGLVLVRGLLESRGASGTELSAYDAEIARVRDDLARLVKRAHDPAPNSSIADRDRRAKARAHATARGN